MKILITGASGFVGKSLTQQLSFSGHQIVTLSRKQCNLNTEIPNSSFFNGVDAIVHLAGEPVSGKRWGAERKKRIYDSRILGTKNLLTALEQLGSAAPKVLISASAVGYYGDCGDTFLDEKSPSGSDFLAKVCRDWEQESIGKPLPFTRQVALRIGVVLGKNGGALEKLLPVFKTGLGGQIGNGKQWMSWIHIDDLTKLIEFSIHNSTATGAFNAVSPNPVTNAEFSKTLAKVLGKNIFFPVPALAMKLALGEMSQIILASQRVSSEKIKKLGYQFLHPNLEKAMSSLL